VPGSCTRQPQGTVTSVPSASVKALQPFRPVQLNAGSNWRAWSTPASKKPGIRQSAGALLAPLFNARSCIWSLESLFYKEAARSTSPPPAMTYPAAYASERTIPFGDVSNPKARQIQRNVSPVPPLGIVHLFHDSNSFELDTFPPGTSGGTCVASAPGFEGGKLNRG